MQITLCRQMTVRSGSCMLFLLAIRNIESWWYDRWGPRRVLKSFAAA